MRVGDGGGLRPSATTIKERDMKNNAAGYRRLAQERKAKAEAEEKNLRERTEYVASLGSGKKSVVGKSFKEVGDKLFEDGYLMKKARMDSAGQLVVPHKDQFKKAVVRKRVRSE